MKYVKVIRHFSLELSRELNIIMILCLAEVKQANELYNCSNLIIKKKKTEKRM